MKGKALTYTIVARGPASGQAAVATASRALAVGGRVVHARGGVGAVASQASINPQLGVDAIDGIEAGQPVEPLLAELMADDDRRDIRQCLLLDWAGHTAAWTGGACTGWAGHRTFDGLVVAGNMLAGGEVLTAMEAAYREGGAKPFAERLLDALDAGEAAGGDKRGRQSAAILIVGPRPYPELDLRVDDHPDPLRELRRLYGLARTVRLC